tara:strand:- start:281 stop:667 length:387 start_codon:yes stop_codon:yes gene_type:complete
MEKINIFWIGILLVVVLVSAGLVAFNNVEKTYSAKEEILIVQDVITFDCSDGESYEVNDTEPNGYDEDDIIRLTRRYCNATISNIQKDGDLWKTNGYISSFDEDVLKKDTCGRNGYDFDSKTGECVLK